MKLLNKLERRFGRYAIPNLMKYVVILYAVGLIMGTINPQIYNQFFALDFGKVMKGQVWRLVTFIIPNESLLNLLFVAISVYLYYMIGNALERAWGAFRLNLYFFSGILFNVIGSLLVYIINPNFIISPSLEVVYTAMFFAFAAIYPNTQFLVLFIIPVKVKYLAWIGGGWIIYSIFLSTYQGIVFHQINLILEILPTVFSMLNFLIFFLATRNYRRISPSEFQRRARFQQQMYQARQQSNTSPRSGHNTITRHKCAVCGRTELDDDQLEFRFCSKCDGNYEYCMDHLFTHEHVKK